MMPGAAHIYLHAQSFQAPALVGGSFVLSLREGAKTHRAHSQRKLEQTLTMRKRTIGSRLSPGMASGDVERELTAELQQDARRAENRSRQPVLVGLHKDHRAVAAIAAQR